MLNISTGVIPRAQKVVIYGSEGVGKTTLAASFPNPLIIDTEGGTAHMDVRRVDKPQSWDELIAIVGEVAATKGICKTLVIDTADWAEQLAVAHVCAKYKQNSIESFGYCRWYQKLYRQGQGRHRKSGRNYQVISALFQPRRGASCGLRVLDARFHVRTGQRH